MREQILQKYSRQSDREGNVQRKIKHHPPVWAQRLLRWYCRSELLEDLEGDLNEYFNRDLHQLGARRARITYVANVLKFIRLYTVRKPNPLRNVNELVVFQNYFKTSLRNIARHKLFSVINTTGLAVSMCLGLLLISIITELKSFDNFHAKAERIFRINNHLREVGGSSYNYATTSLLAGQKIRESVSGIEDVTIIRRGLQKDFHVEDKIVPLKGLWADESFFKVFSFELVAGNPVTVLKDPNSIVLTESTAKKLFNNVDAVGKLLQSDSINYLVTGVVKDPPLNSHMRFDLLASYVSVIESSSQKNLVWDNMWDHYVYVVLPELHDLTAIEESLARLSTEGNRTTSSRKITLYLEPLRQIALSRNMSNSIGPTIDRSSINTFTVFTIVVLISACFNYTNLSIARALRRSREVGIRKVIGASRRQVFGQFLFESVVLSIISLDVAYVLFVFLRSEFLSISERFQEMVTLKPSLWVHGYFLVFSIGVGILAGLAPASLFSRINAAQVLKDLSSVKLFGHINLRKSLIVFQYTLSILFIVIVSIGYKQYRYSLNFDLGFQTENIFSLQLQGNKSAPLIKELSELPEVKQIAHANHVSSTGANRIGNIRYADAADSLPVHYNFIDSEYLLLHGHKLIAGENFKPALSETTEREEIIINERTVKWMQLSNSQEAIGKELIIDGKKYSVIGVVEDFHYERINYPIQNFAFRYDPTRFEILNLKIESADMTATLNKIKGVWKKFDPIHSFSGKFYQDYVHEAYDKLSWIIKIVGFIAFLAISIASLGLLGMVIFTTEKRLKEISIRKVLGASEVGLVLLMGRGFFVLLMISSAIAIPCAYYFMDRIVFGKIVYRASIGALDLLLGTIFIMGIAALMIAVQTLKTAKTNPAQTLRTE